MTIALCLHCGELKFGSLLPCKTCGVVPQGHRARVYSMVLSDHYFDRQSLEEFSRDMKQGAPHPVLEPEQEKKIMVQFRHGAGAADEGGDE